MKTVPALMWAAGATILSGVLLTLSNGLPSTGELWFGGATMFGVAFYLFRRYGGGVPMEER